MTFNNKIKSIPLYSLGLFIIYFLLLVSFGYVVGYSEISQDISMHMKLIGNPFYQFTQTISDQMQHPPLLGLAQAAFVHPILLLTDTFAAFRVGYLIMLVVAFAFFLRTIQLSDMRMSEGYASILCFAFMPVIMIPTIILPQDEMLSLMMVSILALLLIKKQYMWFLFVSGLSVVLAKIYFVIPLAIMLSFLDRRDLLRGVGIGLLPIVSVYLPIIIIAKFMGGVYPMQGFKPTIEFCSGIWTLMTSVDLFTFDEARRISVIIIAVFMLCLMFYAHKFRKYVDIRDMNGIIASAMLFAFLMFDHTNPEYFVMCVPFVLLAVNSIAGKFLSTFALSLPWFINFLFGVRGAVVRGEGAGKSIFVSMYNMFFSFEQIDVILNISLLVVNALIFIVFLHITVNIFRRIKTVGCVTQATITKFPIFSP